MSRKIGLRLLAIFIAALAATNFGCGGGAPADLQPAQVNTPSALASTTWYVNGVSGSDSNTCTSVTSACKTIAHAISLASSGDSIVVAAATYKENLSIGIGLQIVGSGSSTTIIDGGGVASVVTISSTTASVTLSRVTIRNGHAPSGAGIYNTGMLTVSNATVSGSSAAYYGGGIYNSGALKVVNSTISGNTVSNNCYNICQAFGGGIYNKGTLNISNSTLSANSAYRSCAYCHAAGGAIHNLGGKVTISNSTITGNRASATCSRSCDGTGGGIWNNGTLTISNATISGNSAAGTTSGAGGGVYKYDGEGTVTLQNSIVANNSSGGNCSGAMISNGYNLSSDNTCAFNNSGDLNNTDPMLGQLQNNGGPTLTKALLTGSPAIDAGNPSGCTDGQGHLLKIDQRGDPRPDTEDTGGCDMGAYERQSD